MPIFAHPTDTGFDLSNGGVGYEQTKHITDNIKEFVDKKYLNRKMEIDNSLSLFLL